MSMPLELSLLGLSAVMAIESLVLQALVREVRRRQIQLSRPITIVDQRYMPLGRKVPAFSATLYPTNANLTQADLPATSVMLLFVDIADVRAKDTSSMLHLMYYLLGKVDTPLYLFVLGERPDAHWLDEHFGLRSRFGERLQFVLDPQRLLATEFALEATPSAVLVDPQGFVQKLGRPDPSVEDSTPSASPVQVQVAQAR